MGKKYLMDEKDYQKYISVNFLNRLPYYLKHLITLSENGVEFVNARELALDLGYNPEQVKKDLQIVCKGKGKPKIGRSVKELIYDINDFLGYNNTTSAIIVGIGHLGTAFLNYPGFADLGLNLLAGFDIDPTLFGRVINGKMIYNMSRLETVIHKLNVHIAILTTPSSVSNEVAKKLVKCGIKAIWNFSPMVLDVPDDIIVENVNLASSLAVLSHKLNKKLKLKE